MGQLTFWIWIGYKKNLVNWTFSFRNETYLSSDYHGWLDSTPVFQYIFEYLCSNDTNGNFSFQPINISPFRLIIWFPKTVCKRLIVTLTAWQLAIFFLKLIFRKKKFVSMMPPDQNHTKQFTRCGFISHMWILLCPSATILLIEIAS